MNFVNKLLSRILTLIGFVVVLLTARYCLFSDEKETKVLVFSILTLVYVVGVCVYQIVLFVRNRKSEKYAGKGFFANDCYVNLICSGVCVVFSVLSFVLTWVAYLNLITF